MGKMAQSSVARNRQFVKTQYLRSRASPRCACESSEQGPGSWWELGQRWMNERAGDPHPAWACVPSPSALTLTFMCLGSQTGAEDEAGGIARPGERCPCKAPSVPACSAPGWPDLLILERTMCPRASLLSLTIGCSPSQPCPAFCWQ